MFNRNVRRVATLVVLSGAAVAYPTFAFAEDAPSTKPAETTKAADPAKPADAPKDKKKGAGRNANGPLKVFTDHAADLSLTDEQKTKLEKIKADLDTAEEKLKSDPEVVSLQAQMKEARQSGDKDKMKTLHKEFKDLMDKKGADPAIAAVKDAEALLTPDQLAKLKDFEKEAKGAHADKKAAKAGDKPATPAPEKTDKAPETAAKPEAPAAPPENAGGMDK